MLIKFSKKSLKFKIFLILVQINESYTPNHFLCTFKKTFDGNEKEFGLKF